MAISYIGFMLLLLSGTNLGIYTAPIAMLAAFLIPIDGDVPALPARSRPLEFPYLAMSLATLVAAVIAVGFHFLHPAGEWVKLPVIAALMLVWFASLFSAADHSPATTGSRSATSPSRRSKRGRRSSSIRRRACPR